MLCEKCPWSASCDKCDCLLPPEAQDKLKADEAEEAKAQVK